MLTNLELDHAGIAELLKGAELAGVVTDRAEAIAGQVRSQVPDDAEVVVDQYTTDRVAASVTIKHATGLILQARDGVLTRAAASAGLEVTERA